MNVRNSSTWVAEAGESQVQGQPGLQRKNLAQKIKKKKKQGP
jgi:hypothetical protein